MSDDFTAYPALDLRQGKIVRLAQGSPQQQTVFSDDPAATARRWIEAGARWLHVVNLDGAFGEDDSLNRQALQSILSEASASQVQVQFGGGLRTEQAIHLALGLGIQRVVLGTSAVENPDLLAAMLERWGPERIVAGVDARDGTVRVRGWATTTEFEPLALAKRLQETGVRWLVYTDISRDGMSHGLNLEKTRELAQGTFLKVIASGGVRSQADIDAAREAGLAGVIVGKALYTGGVDPALLFKGA